MITVFYRPEKFSNLPKATQVVSRKACTFKRLNHVLCRVRGSA